MWCGFGTRGPFSPPRAGTPRAGRWAPRSPGPPACATTFTSKTTAPGPSATARSRRTRGSTTYGQRPRRGSSCTTCSTATTSSRPGSPTSMSFGEQPVCFQGAAGAQRADTRPPRTSTPERTKRRRLLQQLQRPLYHRGQSRRNSCACNSPSLSAFLAVAVFFFFAFQVNYWWSTTPRRVSGWTFSRTASSPSASSTTGGGTSCAAWYGTPSRRGPTCSTGAGPRARAKNSSTLWKRVRGTSARSAASARSEPTPAIRPSSAGAASRPTRTKPGAR
mmetsp:Transcript_66857/g.151040  ORF Transcript_66857/g.151040 Transcript_66857/m.151040 type:complete len:276 (-) Transcript_66857:123-950(-)